MSEFKSTDKVWVYTSPTSLNTEQKELILQKAKEFLSGWESHGSRVKGEIAVAYDHFVVVVADDCNGNMCGRAQDAQIRFIKEVGQELGTDLTDRMQIAYRPSEDQVEVKKMIDFKSEISNGKIDQNTIVFNNMISTFKELESNWEIPAKDSWHSQLFV